MPHTDSPATPDARRVERRTIVQGFPGTSKPWALVLGGQRVMAEYDTEDEARSHDARIRANESRDVAAIRKELPQWERRFGIMETVLDETSDLRVDYRAEVELRATPSGPQIAMWIPFNSLSEELWGFREIIRPGAFTKTAREADVVALWNHDPTWVLGRRSNRTLSIGLSDDGAEAVAQLDADDAMHRHFARRIERRDVVGASFGFSVVKEKWGTDETHENIPMRELLEVKLRDISPVAFPAYPESGSEKRSLVEVATARTGAAVDELLAALSEVRDGHVGPDRGDLIRDWLGRLEGYVPPPTDGDLMAMRRRKAEFRMTKVVAA